MSDLRLFVGGLVAYAVLLAVSIWILSTYELDESFWRFPVVLLPVPAAVVVGASWLHRWGHLDELEQRIQLIALGAAFIGGLFAVFTWGFLEGVGAPRLTGFAWFGLLWGLYVAGLVWGRIRYS